MSYTAAIEGLYALAGELHPKPGAGRRKFRLEDMRQLLTALGDPQKQFPAVLIAGTNGKGLTAATLASILAAAGYTTGLYTSPHLARVNERIQILTRDGGALRREQIADDDFAALYFRVDEAAAALVREGRLPDHSSFFETVTALAFLHFAAEKIDIAVLEVGMGGRLDATNVVDPLISVITDISLDHTEWLGPTISAIAREKAGILRQNGVLVTLPQHPEANQALGEAAVALEVRGVSAADYVPPPERLRAALNSRYPLTVMGQPIEIASPLFGQHQQRNVALAIAAAVELSNNNGYNIATSAIESGIRQTAWPGRLETLHGRGIRPDVLLDVAHNAAGAWSLRSALSALSAAYSGEKTLVFGCLRDKPVREIAQVLFPVFDRVLVTEVDSPRTAPLVELQEAAEAAATCSEAMPNPQAALERAFDLTPADGLIVVSGSVYLVGALRGLAS